MRSILAVFATLLFAATAQAQIYKVEFKSQKVAKRYKDHSIELNGELVLVGEAKSGFYLDEQANTIKYSPKTNEMWVADMDNPKACPYKLDKKGEKQRNGSKAVVSFNGEDINSISIFIRDQSLYGLTKEYSRRDDEIEDLKKQRDAFKKGSPEWKLKQTALIQTMERLKSWLEETLFERASKKITRDITSEMKAAKEANAQRLELAKASIRVTPVPEDFAKQAREVFGDAVVFHQQESQHLRILYREELGDDRIRACLELGENLIDGFRVQFVDPYVTDDYKDYIRDDQQMVEWFWGPDDQGQYLSFIEKYYGLRVEGPNSEERRKLPGHGTRRGSAPAYVNVWRISEQSDLEGIVAHQMGHHLVNVHYNQDRSNDVADWLYEGVGNWLSLEYLGRNSVQCVQFDIGKYAKKSKGDNNEESGLLMGTADIYHRLALEAGPNLDQLALKQLAEFEDPDVAKSFSIFNYVAKSQGEKGQRWLRACCNAGGVRQSFIPQWRKKSEEIYEVQGKDVFQLINDWWQAFAEEQIGGPISR